MTGQPEPPPRSPQSVTLIHGYQLLSHLMTVNTNLGRAVQRLMDHQDQAGALPTSDLREMAKLFHELADEMNVHADELDRPVIDT